MFVINSWAVYDVIYLWAVNDIIYICTLFFNVLSVIFNISHLLTKNGRLVEMKMVCVSCWVGEGKGTPRRNSGCSLSKNLTHIFKLTLFFSASSLIFPVFLTTLFSFTYIKKHAHLACAHTHTGKHAQHPTHASDTLVLILSLVSWG